jgi:hypothetical protein
MLALGDDHWYRYRGRNRYCIRYRLLQTDTTDCDCNSDPDGFSLLLHFRHSQIYALITEYEVPCAGDLRRELKPGGYAR